MIKLKTLFISLLLITVVGVAWAQQRSADQMTMDEKVAAGLPFHKDRSEAVAPFNVIANIYSVGSKDLGVYLITTDEGHILVDTGVAEMHQQILNNVDALGFKIKDIKILLSTHAHFDHVQGHEAMRQATGAEVMAVGLDAEALRLGKDISPLGFEGWEPVKDVKTLKHEDLVKLGGMILKAHEIPGHTQGCTVWEMNVTEERTRTNVAIFGCRGPNDIVKVQNNKDFPDLVEQTLLGFKRLKEIKPDIYLSNHTESVYRDFGAPLRRGDRPHPLLQQRPWLEMVASLEQGFRSRLH